MSEIFVGIDISKSSFDVAIIDSSSNILQQSKHDMNSLGCKDLLNILSKFCQPDVRIAMESTGIYHLPLLNFLIDNGYRCYVINPVLINSFVKSLTLRKSKTDKIDCSNIAQYLQLYESKLLAFKSEAMITLKPLSRMRETTAMDIAKTKTEIKRLLVILFPEIELVANIFTKAILMLLKKHPSAVRIKRLKTKGIAKEINRSSANKSEVDAEILWEIARNSIGISSASHEKLLVMQIEYLLFLNDRSDELERMISEALDKETNNAVELLISIKGIGEKTARSFIIEIGSINNFKSAKQLAAYIGIDPSIKQSGSSVNVKGKISKKGNSFLRRTIWQIAVAVIRYDGKFREYFLKKKTEGKKYKQSIIAVANKLLRTLFALLSNRKEFAIK